MTRLHVQPLTPELLRAIVPASATELIENLSYHSLQTFPDNSYGYFDLPAMEADKLKKKLNGAILKGKKITVEEARPRKRRHEDEEADVPAIDSVKPTIGSTAPKPKTPKKASGVIKGHSISPDRKVKRGWTEARDGKTKRSKKDKSNRPASKYTDMEELLFQTKVPANRKDLIKEDRKKNGKKRNSDGDVVHEFEKTAAQPSFLRSNAPSTEAGKTSMTFIDGTGWVDENGKVIEEEPATAKRSRASVNTRMTRSFTAKEVSSEESSSSSDDDSTPRPVQRNSKSKQPKTDGVVESEATSSSGSSDAESEIESNDSNPVSSQASSGEEDRASSPNPNASIHPLEALFKKPSKPATQDIAKPSLEVQTSFAFFNQSGEDLEEETVPETPFSSQDTRSRGHRSAAPTPDTAHPSRYNSYSSQFDSNDEDEDDEDEDDGPATRSQTTMATPSKPSQGGHPEEQSIFEKQFWEKRGELGRGWKRRRREVRKEKRQREKRANKRAW